MVLQKTLEPSEYAPVTVIVCCYNYGRYLSEALDSVLRQSRPPAQILVVDDGSTDETQTVLQSYADVVESISISHAGICEARNIGLARASEDFLLFLDADDRLEPRCVELAIEEMMRTDLPKADCVYMQKRHFGAAEDVSAFPAFDMQQIKKRNYILVTSLLRTRLVRGAGFDPDFAGGYEDYDFFIRLIKRGGVFRLLDQPLVQVRIHDRSRTITMGRSGKDRLMINRLVKKHRDWFSPSEATAAQRRAANREMLSLIAARRADASLVQRLLDTWRFARASVRHMEFYRQCLYLLAPRHYCTAKSQ